MWIDFKSNPPPMNIVVLAIDWQGNMIMGKRVSGGWEGCDRFKTETNTYAVSLHHHQIPLWMYLPPPPTKKEGYNEMGYAEIAAIPSGIIRAKHYLVSALLVQDQKRHMTWCVERALEALGEDLESIQTQLAPDYIWKKGVGP